MSARAHQPERTQTRAGPSGARPLFIHLTYSQYFGTVPLTMLMIRFQRIGRKNDAAFRMAVLPKASGPKAGKYVDLVGTYNPKTKAITVDAEKIKDWVSKGAQMSPSLHNLLVKNGTIEGTKTANVVSKKSLEKNIKAKAEADAKEAAAKAAADAKAAEAAKAEAEAAAQAAAAEAEAPAAEEVVAEAPTEEAAPATEETPAA